MKHRLTIVVSLLFLFAVAATWVLADDDSTYLPLVTGPPQMSACVNNSLGTIHVIEEGVATFWPCAEGEMLIQWNVEGPTGPQGEQGPQGAQGPQGEQGPPGVLGFYQRVGDYVKDNPGGDHIVTGHANCDPGDVVTGGGFDEFDNEDVYYIRSGPSSASGGIQGWGVKINMWDHADTINFRVWAVCADITP